MTFKPGVIVPGDRLEERRFYQLAAPKVQIPYGETFRKQRQFGFSSSSAVTIVGLI